MAEQDADHTYSGDPSDSDKDAIRFLISDKGLKPWLFTDNEIAFSLIGNGNIYTAAAGLAETQAASYADLRDKTVGPLSIKYGDVAQRWNELAANLRSRKGKQGAGPLAITTQKSTSPHFTLGIHDIYADRFPLLGDPRDLTDYDDLLGL